MVSLFRKPTAEPDLDGRIAGLARRRFGGQPPELVETKPVTAATAPEPARPTATTGPGQSAPSVARVELFSKTDFLKPGAPSPDYPVISETAPSIASLSALAPELSSPSPFIVAPAEPPSRQPGAAAFQRPTATPAPEHAEGESLDDKLLAARTQLSTRLAAEIRPERRSLLSRGELAKLVDAAVQAHFVRNS